MALLKVSNVAVSAESKNIIKDLSMEVLPGEVVVLMGPNGSGKSTFANALMGNPQLSVSGSIIFEGEDISKLKTFERARAGLFLSFQNPVSVEGVSIKDLLRRSQESAQGGKSSFVDFKRDLSSREALLGLDKDFSRRHVNTDFSGGEKKKGEILQMLTLKPKLAILDEPDSGLDVDSLKSVASAISNFLKENKGSSVIIITHYRRILEYLSPDRVLIMHEGRIVKQGGSELVDEIESEGFAKFKISDAEVA